MKNTDIQISICGSAGDGTIAAGDILKRALAKGGFKVIAFDVYPPEIRGFGKCISRVRVTTEQVYSLKHHSDVLVSLDDSHAIPHVGEVRDSGAVIYEDTPISGVLEGSHISAHISPGQIPYGLPVREISEKETSGNRSRNIVALGYLAGLIGMEPEIFHETIADKFRGKAIKITDMNVAAFDKGYALGQKTFKLDDVTVGKAKKSRNKDATITMMNGNAAVVQGCMDAHIKTFFGYPITPATTIMEKLATEMPKVGGRLLQTEDEISAIAATIGAGYAGSRCATATSGPGLALMAEMLGLGVVAELPSVIFVSQRGGPSTGLPTKTEQSDLNLAVYGRGGDGQIIVLAPTNVEGCYKCAGKAFEMAEQYQTPVIVLLDLYLSNRFETVELPKQSPFTKTSNKAAKKKDLEGGYKRYAFTKDLVSPRALPGQENGMHTITGLEHNELGRPSDQPRMHEDMSAKRHNKLLAALSHHDITIEKRFGDEGDVDVGILGWGSNFGECLEAMFKAREEGIRCSAMKVVMLSPLPLGPINDFMDASGEVFVPELNYEGQFANLIQGATARSVHSYTRVPGSPMRVEDMLVEIRRLAKIKKAKKIGKTKKAKKKAA
ncbi:MAG: 2-oxoacid:acceptor oxidoreductase subunit alpha [Alphaproteobacteria bacterium]|nr:2-oxoacid:acceptor oxidoreductase subunit alpha [Alphaproteobacteria bacterium]